MKRILLAFRPLAIIVVSLWAAWFVVSRISASREDYRRFSERREAWHARCDVYRDQPRSTAPAAQLCAKELQELVAYAKARGWTP